MSAKHKLNAAHFMGSLLVAGLIGDFFSSWVLFFIAFVALPISGMISRDLR